MMLNNAVRAARDLPSATTKAPPAVAARATHAERETRQNLVRLATYELGRIDREKGVRPLLHARRKWQAEAVVDALLAVLEDEA